MARTPDSHRTGGRGWGGVDNSHRTGAGAGSRWIMTPGNQGGQTGRIGTVDAETVSYSHGRHVMAFLLRATVKPARAMLDSRAGGR